jgi:4-amino-4-deoxy-L-arabinose transferase-like glycosyltransferase
MNKIREKAKEFIGKTHIPVWLAIFLAIIIVLRIPTFFEPFSYGDETIYLTLGQGIKQGLTLYQDVYDNKPPLLYLVAALAGNVFWFKAILAFWNIITIVLFWHLAKTFFPKNERVSKIATVIFGILTTIPLFEGNIANAEVFMIGPIILALYLLFSKKLDFKNIFIAGSLFSLAALFKIPAAFDLPAVIVFWLIKNGLKKDALLKTIRNSLILLLGFATPIAATFIWFFFKGALKEYFFAAFLQNFGYLSSWRGGVSEKSFLVRNLPLFIRALVVVAGAVILWFKRQKLSKEFIFITLWLLFGLFAVSLSERPYPHYLIQIVPELALLLGILLADKTLLQSLSIIPLLVAFSVPVIYKFWYYPTTPYYWKFIQFAVGKTDRQTYFSTFGSRVNSDYQVADFIVKSTYPKDKIFVWGSDSSNIYALSRHLPPSKFVADYHINDFSSKELEAKKLYADKPVLIIITPKAGAFPQLIALLRTFYIPISTIDGTEVWHLKTTETK